MRRWSGLSGVVPGMLVLALPVALALYGMFLDPEAPYRQDAALLMPPGWPHLMGTDGFGRDVLARLAAAGARGIGGAVLVLVLSSGLGLALGTLATLAGGRTEAISLRAVDALNGIPPLVVPLAVVGLLGTGQTNLMLAVLLGFLPGHVRVARALAADLRHRPFIEVASLMGIGRLRVALTHFGRPLAMQMLVIALLDLGLAVSALAGLSYLGLGAQPPVPDWGTLLAEGQTYFAVAPWLLVFPALAVFCLVLGANLLGEALQDRQTTVRAGAGS